MDKIIQISTTADDRDLLESIGRDLVEKKLVACAQILGPIKSIYRWKGNVEHADEWILLTKTKTSLYPLVEQEIRKRHSYELPEIVATDTTSALPEYLQWVRDETL